MNWFDRDILAWMNHFARLSYPVDVTIAWIATSNALKGGLATVVLLWFWFGDAPDQRRNREVIVATFAAAAMAIIAGRALALLLPFRVRPAHNVEIGFVAPYGYSDILRGWSAFPSDHAMLFMAMATGLWFLSRRLGLVAYLYTGVVILAPRVYLGMHHPTDVVFGALLGVTLAALANAEPIRARLASLPLRWSTAHARSFYAAAFLVALQVATMFDAPRQFAREVRAMLEARPAAEASARGRAAPHLATPALEPIPSRASETALR